MMVGANADGNYGVAEEAKEEEKKSELE